MPANSGVYVGGSRLSIIAPLAEARQHAQLFAAIYMVSYLSFSLPVVIAGLAVSTAGIMSTAVVYGEW